MSDDKTTVTVSQSLWVRDRFLIDNLCYIDINAHVAIPLGQGQVFNFMAIFVICQITVAIPLGQGQVFNRTLTACRAHTLVAIPLGQGQVFNTICALATIRQTSQSLWVRDRFLIYDDAIMEALRESQSLWVRDRFLIL